MAIYFDHAATTPMRLEVVEAMVGVMKEEFGNPSSIHSFGRTAKKLLNDSRKIVADTMAVCEREIVFTSGGTESDNTAIIETAFARAHIGKHLITTQIEHPAVLHAFEYLEHVHDFEVTYLPVNEQGELSVESLRQALRKDTTLVSVMYTNNEIGNFSPIRAIGELLANHSAYFHVDAVQAVGLEAIYPHELKIDLLSASAHKFNGPKGVGFLFVNNNVSLPARMIGGQQEEKRRAGTENLPGIVGMAKALEILTPEVKVEQRKKEKELNRLLLEKLKEANIRFSINGSKNRSTHIVNLHIHGVPSDLLLMNLDLKGFAVSTGSACTAGTVDPSHVLCAMHGKEHVAIKESIRVSFGYENTIEEVECLAQAIIEITERFQR